MQIPARANNLCRGLTRLKHLTQNSSGGVLTNPAEMRSSHLRGRSRKGLMLIHRGGGGGGEEPNNFETVEEKWIHVGH